jgi:hypothetical protein
MNVLRMHTAVKINKLVLEHSREAQLVLMNCPGIPDNTTDGHNYMHFLEVWPALRPSIPHFCDCSFKRICRLRVLCISIFMSHVPRH